MKRIRCVRCDRIFSSMPALQQHRRDSPAHTSSFDCEKCGESFDSEQELEQHSPAHVPVIPVSYIGIPRSAVSPVFATARRLRFREPTVDDILRRTKTELNNQIVSALIAAALRLLPVDDMLHGIALQTEKLCLKAAKA